MTLNLIEKPLLNQPTIQKLANGLTIIAEQMPVEAVNLNVWLNVGSAKEADEINGMAHFLEHMVFKGTPKLEIGEFEQVIEEKGAITPMQRLAKITPTITSSLLHKTLQS